MPEIRGPREPFPGGSEIDTRRTRVRQRPTLVPQGSTFGLTVDGTYIVTGGVAGATNLVLPPPGGASRFEISNKGSGTVTIEPNGSTLNGSASKYTMAGHYAVLVAVHDTVWLVLVDTG